MSCQCGCGRLIHRDSEVFGMPQIPAPYEKSPDPPVPGKLHLCRWLGRWCLIGDSKAPGMGTATYWIAFDHIKTLEAAWKDLNLFVDYRPPQNIEFTERQDPTRWI